jgi:hypothetical protein
VLTKSQVIRLKATGKVAEVEDEGMDEGRFFVHLTNDYTWNDGYGVHHTKSFGSFKEVLAEMKSVTHAPCKWFALCDHAAVTTRAHPILGNVPICKRCDDKIASLEVEG